MNSSADRFQFSRKPGEGTRPAIPHLPFLAVVAALLWVTNPANAANLLVNPSFEQNSGHVIPNGWTRFEPPTAQPAGNYWVENTAGIAHSGLLFFKEWGASYAAQPTNVAGIYQDLSSAPGSTYQASGWLYINGSDVLGADCYVWLEVSFLNSSSNVLALYKSDPFNASVGTGNWFQYDVTNACDVSTPISIGDPYFTTYAVTGSVSQLVAPVGTAKVRYRFAYTQVNAEGGSCYFDDAVLDQISGPIPPVINNVFPLNMIFVNPADGISFDVSSPSGFTIDPNKIGLVLNGTNVSGSLGISGTASSKHVTYSGLQSNMTYTASITVTDSFNLTASASSYFETTWVDVDPVVYLWEAEDFDFNSGMYINNPVLCSASGDPNCYFGTVGVEGVDEHNQSYGPNHQYRPDDAMGTAVSGDYSRKKFYDAGVFDYAINPFNYSEWVNYTRDWPVGTNWVVARLATDVGLSGSLTLSRVDSETNITDLGTFTITGGHGWTSFENIYLKDTNGSPVNVVFNGKATLRVTSGGNLLPGFFMLVPAQVDLPRVINMYPTGNRPFEFTNALSFTATTVGATFPTNGIKVILDGSDISAALAISGPASAPNVRYSGLQPNAMHTALIIVTNSLGHGIIVTNSFDTFSQDNYMVEAEDFDYDGGQYVASWFPDAYGALGAFTNIDFQHTTIEGELYPYRLGGIPESLVQNYAIEARAVFVDVGAFDYQLDWFGIGDWANYTRDYPAGSYYVYVRTAGILGTPYSMDLDQVVNGAGSTNQVLKHLGRWGATAGHGQQQYDWVPLTDDGLGAPAAVKLGGVGTLRLSTSTGLCYPNYFMFVPASAITLSAARSGGNINLVFPTQTGASYRIFDRAALATGSWTALTNVPGDGTVKAVSVPAPGNQRYYKVTSP